MNFKVVFASPQGVATKKYKGTDTYDVIRGGVLRVEVQQPPDRGVHYFAQGHWIEVAEYADPVTPKLKFDG
ncbi:MAG TPA: hypothetical protein VFQ37_14600 [Mycobacterium sp.]|nr:hypothetical protein [Mycobacterium sp.]